MSDFADYLEAAVIDYFFRPAAVAPTRPTSVKAHLYTATPGETGGGTEVTGGSYASQDCGFGASSQVSGKAESSNAADITYPAATAGWGTVSHVAVKDHVPNYLAFKALDASRTVLTNDVFKFLAGNLKVNVA